METAERAHGLDLAFLEERVRTRKPNYIEEFVVTNGELLGLIKMARQADDMLRMLNHLRRVHDLAPDDRSAIEAWNADHTIPEEWNTLPPA